VRWPRIRFQVAHLGGTIPFLAERLAGLGDAADTRAFLQRLFYDTALAADPLALAAAREFAGATQVVLGSDWPYVDAIDDAAARFGANGAALLRRQLHGVR
jgi:predicted TIM-barrel fold metal-dependent hydrolase